MMLNTNLNIKISDYLKNKNASCLEHKDGGGSGFDPNQPRDEKGRWTSTGSSSVSSKTAAEVTNKVRETVGTVDKTIESTGNIKGKAKYKKYDNLTNQEMDERITRLDKEHRLSDLQGETKYIKSGRDKVREALQTVGAALAAVATVFTIRHLILQDKQAKAKNSISHTEETIDALVHGTLGLNWRLGPGGSHIYYNASHLPMSSAGNNAVSTVLKPKSSSNVILNPNIIDAEFTEKVMSKAKNNSIRKATTNKSSAYRLKGKQIVNAKTNVKNSEITKSAVTKTRTRKVNDVSKPSSNKGLLIALGVIGAATIAGTAYYIHKRNKKKEEMQKKFNSAYQSAIDKVEDNYLMHYGKKGQKWGIRNYQNPDGSLTAKGEREYKKNAKISGQSKGQIMGSIVGGGLVATTLALKRVRSKSVKNPNVFSGGMKIVGGVLAGAMIGSMIGKKIGKSEGKGDMAEYKNAYITSDIGRKKKRS